MEANGLNAELVTSTFDAEDGMSNELVFDSPYLNFFELDRRTFFGGDELLKEAFANAAVVSIGFKS
jgi:hypothetical protein